MVPKKVSLQLSPKQSVGDVWIVQLDRLKIPQTRSSKCLVIFTRGLPVITCIARWEVLLLTSLCFYPLSSLQSSTTCSDCRLPSWTCRTKLPRPTRPGNIYTLCLRKKTGHFIFGYNCHTSWSIFINFVPLETEINIIHSYGTRVASDNIWMWELDFKEN